MAQNIDTTTRPIVCVWIEADDGGWDVLTIGNDKPALRLLETTVAMTTIGRFGYELPADVMADLGAVVERGEPGIEPGRPELHVVIERDQVGCFPAGPDDLEHGGRTPLWRPDGLPNRSNA